MRKVVLYIAMSLDGYIADENGGVEWLAGDGSDNDNMGSLPSFMETIDTVILGYKTYYQIVTELSPDNWIYEGKMSYVFTHKNLESKKGIQFTQQNLIDFISQLKVKQGKDIWICGGAEIVNQLINNDMIDSYCVSIIPTILGKGIKLFHMFNNERKLQLISTQCYNGIVDLVYCRRT